MNTLYTALYIYIQLLYSSKPLQTLSTTIYILYTPYLEPIYTLHRPIYSSYSAIYTQYTPINNFYTVYLYLCAAMYNLYTTYVYL